MRARHLLITWIFAMIVSLWCMTGVAFAQDTGRSSGVVDLAKAVLLDPTTYVPATTSYTSQRLDWKTSQVLFNAGWVEHNPRYTLSGRPDDKPVSFEAGNRRIRSDALAHLKESLVNNVTAQVFERVLEQRYPEHRKLVKTLSWVERISFSGYVGYLASVDHFRQAKRNQAMARQFGL